MNKHEFLRRSPWAYAVVPLLFTLLTLLVMGVAVRVFATPYISLASWFFSSNQATRQPQDLFTEAVDLMNGEGGEEPEVETIPLSSITYPVRGDRYGRITISNTTVDAPLYYGDTNAILNQGVGTYMDDERAGIPGESKTILLAGHNNTFFNDLQSVQEGETVTIETHYGTYTYTVERCEILDYQDASAYDFTRTDENLILYTCYPFDAMGFTPNRYFVYASYTSGPRLAADQ